MTPITNLTPTTQLLYIMLIVLMYCYFAISLQTIAKKLGDTEVSWSAWVPVANLYLLCRLGRKPWWWLLLLVVPTLIFPHPLTLGLSSAVAVIIWMEIARRRGKPFWIALLLLLPVINLFVPGYIAFVDNTNNPTTLPINR